MADVQAAKRYAQAVFAIAESGGSIGRWRSDLEDIAAVLAESELAGRFADARISVEDRERLAERVLDLPSQPLNLARLLISKGRSGDARAVADAFNRLADAAEGIVHAEVTTAVVLTDAEVQSIAGRLGEQLSAAVTVATRVDPSIVGGLVVRVGDRMIDGSIRTRLRELRRELVGAR
jgi:F-type H+-transporting ATPase subunit delta